MNQASPTSSDQTTVPTVRLIQVLRTYCHGLDPAGTQDLRRSLADGRFPWLRDELTATIVSAGPMSWWADAVGQPTVVDGRRNRYSAREEQRRVWRSLFPGEPFPRIRH